MHIRYLPFLSLFLVAFTHSMQKPHEFRQSASIEDVFSVMHQELKEKRQQRYIIYRNSRTFENYALLASLYAAHSNIFYDSLPGIISLNNKPLDHTIKSFVFEILNEAYGFFRSVGKKEEQVKILQKILELETTWKHHPIKPIENESNTRINKRPEWHFIDETINTIELEQPSTNKMSLGHILNK